MPKIYLSASTQENNKGVLNYGTEEYQMFTLRDRTEYYLNKGGKKFDIFKNVNKTWSLSQIVSDSNSKNPEIHMSFHTNAGPEAVRGCECYYSMYNTNGLGKKLAEIWYKNVSAITPTKDRGVMSDKILYSNGLYELRKTNAVAVLMEHIFHTNENDVKWFLSNIDNLAIAAAKTIYQFYGYTFKLEEKKFSYSDKNLKWLYDNKLIYGENHKPGETFSKSEIGLILKRLYDKLK